jgi:hypothetical protein
VVDVWSCAASPALQHRDFPWITSSPPPYCERHVSTFTRASLLPFPRSAEALFPLCGDSHLGGRTGALCSFPDMITKVDPSWMHSWTTTMMDPMLRVCILVHPSPLRATASPAGPHPQPRRALLNGAGLHQGPLLPLLSERLPSMAQRISSRCTTPAALLHSWCPSEWRIAL